MQGSGLGHFLNTHLSLYPKEGLCVNAMEL